MAAPEVIAGHLKPFPRRSTAGRRLKMKVVAAMDLLDDDREELTRLERIGLRHLIATLWTYRIEVEFGHDEEEDDDDGTA